MGKEVQEEGVWAPQTPSKFSFGRQGPVSVDKKRENHVGGKKTRRKKYWPKVLVEVKPKKTKKTSTPKPYTPKPSKHATSKRSAHWKRKDADSPNASTKPLEDVMVDFSERGTVLPFSLENQRGNEKENDSKASVRRALNFNVQNHEKGCEKDARVVIHQYQRREKKMDTSSCHTNSTKQSKEGVSIVQNSADIPLGFTKFGKCIQSTHAPVRDRWDANDPNQTGGCNNSLKVYQRIFRVNQCRSSSRKLGPNFPMMWKKRRMRRQKATLFSTFMAAEDGTRRQNTTMYDTLLSIIHAEDNVEDNQRILKKGRKKRQKTTKCGNWQVVGSVKNTQRGVKAKKYSSKQLASQLRGKDVPVEVKSSSMVCSSAIANCGVLVPNYLGLRILTTKSQILAAVNDPSSFKCILSLNPLATSKNKRSNKCIRRLSLTSGPTCNHLRSPLIQSDHDVLLGDSESMVTKRRYERGFLDNSVSDHNKLEGCFVNVFPTQESLQDKFLAVSDHNRLEGCSVNIFSTLESLQDKFPTALLEVVEKLECLHISDAGGQLVVQNQNENRAMIIRKKRKRKPPPKLDIDEETMRMWNLLTATNQGENDEEESDKDKEKWWEGQRKFFSDRVDSFIARMHLVQGDRRFSPWKGSVVDSVVGVFLTQNVSDHLSSSAFMSLTAKYPPIRTAPAYNKYDEVGEITYSHNSIGSDISVVVQNGVQNEGQNCGCIVPFGSEAIVEQKATPKVDEAAVGLCGSLSNCHVLPECSSLAEVNQAKGQPSGKNHQGGSEIIDQSRAPSRKKKSGVEERSENPVDWDELRRTYVGDKKIETTGDTMDSVDWEAVRQATVDEVADVIKGRGQHNIIAGRIKEFLNRVVRDHGSINLEWLRSVPPEKAKEYLLSFNGLGLKSVECVRLLTLHHHAFPVDTNVGRVAVRLGWVPLKPLPESLQIHLLEQYPVLDSIQIYLWPRLCTLDQQTLYELHYQLITFGKVFCRKRNPNCNACPMRGECRHFASEFASARLALPGPQEKNVVNSMVPYAAVQNSGVVITPAIFSESRYQNKNCEPIIEHPPSPEPVRESIEYLERDIEDLFYEDEDDDYIPTIRLNADVFKEKIQEFIDMNNISLEGGEISNALVALTSEAASMPMPKLKDIFRLRTTHHVYELPDSHRLLAGFEKREPDDPSPYLLAIWTSGGTATSLPRQPCDSSVGTRLCNKYACCSSNNFEDQSIQTVFGTVLIPCRTATRGSFPLNGTYFQVNEVFADDETSQCPLNVPRAWLWTLRRRTLYCGAEAAGIFRGLSTAETQSCFWRGFICVRAFNRKTRAPAHLPERFHVPTVLRGKRKFKENDVPTVLRGKRKFKKNK